MNIRPYLAQPGDISHICALIISVERDVIRGQTRTLFLAANLLMAHVLNDSAIICVYNRDTI